MMNLRQPTKEQLIKTAMILEGFGDLQKAARYYVKAREFIRSAKLYEGLQDYTRAGDAYYAAGKMSKALQMYLKAGRNDQKIAVLYERIGNYRKAAEVWKSLKHTRNWKRCVQQSKQLSLFDFKP